MSGLLDGVERELLPTAPIETKAVLQTFRHRLESSHVTRKRKRFERRLEACIQSSALLRSAWQQHIAKVLPTAVERAKTALEQARLVLAGHGSNTALEPQ